MKLDKPHDTLFKNAFSQPRAARALVEPSLPPALVESINWMKLKSVGTELQGPDGTSSRCDLVFEVDLGGEGERSELLLHLNLEHQSSVVKEMIYRCAAYAGNLLYRVMRDREQKDVAPAVLSVVVSNAPKRWDAPTQLSETYALSGRLADQLMPMLAQHTYAVVDLCELDDEQQKARAWAAWQRLVLVLLRKGRDADVLEVLGAKRALVEEVARRPEGQARLNLALWYVEAVNNHEAVNPKKVNDALACAGSESKRHARANWEAYKAGLMAEGLEQGRVSERREMLLALLEGRFGDVVETKRSKILEADADQLKAWALRVLHADSIDAVFSEG